MPLGHKSNDSAMKHMLIGLAGGRVFEKYFSCPYFVNSPSNCSIQARHPKLLFSIAFQEVKKLESIYNSYIKQGIYAQCL